MAYGSVNADTLVTSTSGGILGAGNASIMKNRIINGAMVISQRYGTSAVSDAANIYTLDRWTSIASLGSKFSVQQNAGSVTPPTGFTNYLGVTSSSAYAVTAGQAFVLQQAIEGFNTADLGWGTANAKTVTLSFQVYSSLTGTFGGVITNSAQNRSYPFTYSIPTANTWTTASVTIAGDTSGTWIGATNGIGMSVFFGLGVGTSLSGTAGAWSGSTYYSATGATSVVGTSGATFYITGVQLEVGSSATGFEYRQYGQELALCQRYCYAIYSSGSSVGMFAATSTTAGQSILALPVTARVAPTGITASSNWNMNSYGAGSTPSVTPTYASATANAFAVNCSSGSGFVVGLTGTFYATSANGYIYTTGSEL